MENEIIQKEVALYFSGNMNSQQRREFEGKIKENPLYKAEFEAYSLLDQAFEDGSTETPSGKLRSRFYHNLEAFQLENDANQKSFFPKPYRTHLKWAAGIALFILGYGLNHILPSQQPGLSREVALLREEVQEVKTDLLFSQLKNPLTSDRLKAVQISYDLKDINEPIMDELIHLIKNDASTNVRLAAANALFQHREELKIQNALWEALNYQEDVTMKITLINMLGTFDINRARSELDSLIRQEDFPLELKNELKDNLLKL